MCQRFIITFLTIGLLFAVSSGVYGQVSSVSGLIHSQVGDQPIAGAEIYVKEAAGDSDSRTSSNTDGSFDLETEVIAPFTIVVAAEGYETQELSIQNSVTYFIKVNLSAEAKGVAISGRILDQQGRAISLADIKIGEDSTGVGVVRSAIDGGFELQTELEPPLTLIVSNSGYQRQVLRILNKRVDDLEVKLEQRRTRLSYDNTIPPASSKVPAIVRGNIIDANGTPQEFVNVYVKNIADGQIGTVSQADGSFELEAYVDPPFSLMVSSLGYRTLEVPIYQKEVNDLSIKLIEGDVELDAVIVQGPPISEEMLRFPLTVESITLRDIQNAPTFDYYDGLATLKDVEVSTQSMQSKSVNTRGFNSTENTRFIQLVDGMDNQAPGFGFPMGNFAGLPELDVASMELIPGPSTARYANAFNGLLQMTSKDPFLYQGFSSSTKLAMNNFQELGRGSGLFDVGGDPIFEIAVRYAKSVSPKTAFKTNFSVTRASDWAASNDDNIGPGERFQRLFGMFESPGYDGVNVYGDEIQSKLPIGTGGRDVTVSRTGYREIDLVDYDFTNVKADISVHHKLGADWTTAIGGRVGTGNTFHMGDNRNYLGNFTMFQLYGQIRSSRLTSRIYTTQQRTGNSFDTRILARHLILEAKSNEQWFRDYEFTFNGGLRNMQIVGGGHQEARRTADLNIAMSETAFDRFEPGSGMFESRRTRLIQTLGFENGAGFFDNSSLYHFETQYDFADHIHFADVESGVHYRLWDPNSKGTVFADTTGNNITMSEVGGYVSVGKDVSLRTRVDASLRADKNENFSLRFTPRASVVYQLDENSFLRFLFQNGFRNPSLREQYIWQNLGEFRLLGGQRQFFDPLDLPGNSFSTQAVAEFNAEVDEITVPRLNPAENITEDEAEVISLPILQEGLVQESDLRGIVPEEVMSWEVGYRSLLLDKRLVVDVNYYLNSYNNFIGVKRFIKPHTDPAVDLVMAARQVNESDGREVYYIYANADERVITQGANFSLDYTSYSGVIVGMNGTWAHINNSENDQTIPGFNTPRFKTNYTVGHNRVTENIGFRFTLVTRPAFEWRSNFGDGTVEDYFSLDFQLNMRLPSVKGIVKFGISNVGNDHYINVFGGPTITSLPYLQFTYDPKSFE